MLLLLLLLLAVTDALRARVPRTAAGGGCWCCPSAAAAVVLQQAAEGPEDGPALMQFGFNRYTWHQRVQLVQGSTNHPWEVVYQQQCGLLHTAWGAAQVQQVGARVSVSSITSTISM